MAKRIWTKPVSEISADDIVAYLEGLECRVQLLEDAIFRAPTPKGKRPFSVHIPFYGTKTEH